MTSEAVQDAIGAGWIQDQKTGTWTTKDGRVLLISDMSDNHLINTIRMLRRHYVRKLATVVAWYATCTGPQGDMAQMAFDSEFGDLCGEDWRAVADPVFWQLVAEAKRRPEIRDNATELLENDLHLEQTAIELSIIAEMEHLHEQA